MDNSTRPAPISPSIETASATTSPDNCNSGHTVYLVAIGVVLGLTLLLTGVVTSVQSIASTASRSDYSSLREGYQNSESYGNSSRDEMRQRAAIGC